MVSDERWQQSQAGENAYWQRTRRSGPEFLRIAHEKAVAAAFLAQTVPEFLARPRGERPTAYEVGIGAFGIGVTSFLPDVLGWDLVGLEPQERVGVELGPLLDPMAHAVEQLSYTHLMGQGEAAPLESASFDLVVCYNVLEHVQDPGQVVREMRRLVRPDGLAFLGENCLSLAGHAKLKVVYGDSDPNHPHHFTLGKLCRLVVRSGFDILHRDPVPHEPWWNLMGRFRKRLLIARPV